MSAPSPLPGPRRPAAWSALCFGVGILLAAIAEVPALPLFGAALLLLLAALVLRDKYPRAGSLLFPLLLCTLGGLRFATCTTLLPVNHILRQEAAEDREGLFTGTVAEEPEQHQGRTRFAFDLEEVRIDSLCRQVSGRVLVSVRDLDLHADLGDRLTLSGRLQRPAPARNPGAFDYRAFLELEQIHFLLALRRPEQLVAIDKRPGPWLWERVVLPVRHSVEQSITRNLSGGPAGLLLGVLLGEKYALPDELRADFRLTGLTHALVVSGLNVALVVLFFLTAFKLCRLPERLALVLTLVAVALFALVTQLQAPVVRAGLMAGALLLGRLCGRPGEVYNGLGLAALIILVWQPASLLSLSFQLSFVVTLSLVGLSQPIAALFPASWRSHPWAGEWVLMPLCACLAAQVGTAPLIAYHFNQFSPISLVSNLVVLPLLNLALAIGMLTGITGWCLPLLATAFNGSNYLVLELAIALVECFARLPFASVQMSRPGMVSLGFWVLLSLCLAFAHHRLARKAALFLALLWGNCAVWTPLLRSPALEVFFLDVGQGDAALVRLPDGRSLLIDGGERSPDFDQGERVILPVLRHLGIDRLEAVVASHPHNDHIGGLIAVLEGMEVEHYLDSGQYCDTWTAQRLQELVREKGIHYHCLAAGDSIAGLGGAGGLVLHPGTGFVSQGEEPVSGFNNGSVVLRLSYGEVDLLFAGDAEQEAEASLLRWGGRLRCEVLKVPHHGSPTSSEPAFVGAVQPQAAVVSVGQHNKFRHPSPAVIARYEKQGVQVLRTDQRGAVVLRTDGKTIGWQTMVE
ncbi:MAG: DNA internalization-related competence protein ComEC/Rec2 [Candidatus Latescibacteria bacterium]|nr:DNA internalization-related competence protein ComEC/Rec2 [Candidatus Latescibacterota bacterium]